MAVRDDYLWLHIHEIYTQGIHAFNYTNIDLVENAIHGTSSRSSGGVNGRGKGYEYHINKYWQKFLDSPGMIKKYPNKKEREFIDNDKITQ